MSRLRAFATIVLLVAASTAHVSSYTVRPGENLSGIASRLGVSTKALAAANGITEANHVEAGQRLVVPGSASATPQRQGQGAVEHVVKRGENLADIARRYGTTVAAVARTNGVRNPNQIRIGSRLVVAVSDAPAANVKGAQCPVAGAGRWDFVNGFGSPRSGGRRHKGIDIFARRGTPVVAPVGGIVRHVTNPLGGLSFELVAASGGRVYGAHLSGLARPGRVEPGDVIGWVGTSGNAAGTPPQLHVEWHPNGRGAVNPYSLLREWC